MYEEKLEFGEPIEKEYCFYCKDEILDTDEIVRRKISVYHKFCWFQKTNNLDELDFNKER